MKRKRLDEMTKQIKLLISNLIQQVVIAAIFRHFVIEWDCFVDLTELRD